MPKAPATLRPRGASLSRSAEQDYDARRQEVPWRAWYKWARWRRLREAQLADEPLCRMCFAVGREVPATVCDHVVPHRGNPARFWAGPFQSLCEACHSGPKQRQERRLRIDDGIIDGEWA